MKHGRNSPSRSLRPAPTSASPASPASPSTPTTSSASGPASKSTASATAATAATPGATSTAPSPTRTSTASPSSQAPPKSVIVVVNNGSFTSQDDGHSWDRALASDVFPLNYPRCITVKPGNPNTVFLGLGDFTPGRTGAILRSRDGGESWDNLDLPVEPNSAIWAFGTHPSDPQLIFAGSRYGYLYRSDNGGDSWSKEWREFSEIAAIAWVPS